MVEPRPEFSFATFVVGGEELPAVVVGEFAYDLREVLPGTHRLADLFGAWDARLDEISERLADDAAVAAWHSRDIKELRPIPPVQPVGAVIAAGANYREHILQLAVAHKLGRADATDQELRDEAADETDRRAREGDPYVWIGASSAVSGATDDVQLPGVGEHVDWEVELGVVISKEGFGIAVADAEQFIAGYVICNDISVRSLIPRTDPAMMGTDWFRSKNFPGFFPTGPLLRPARFVGSDSPLHIELRLNGELKQEGDTDDLLFGVPQLISYISSHIALRPGDMIITGSPPGNGSHWGRFLRDGDVMEATITGLGTQRSVVRGPAPLPPWYAQRAGATTSVP